MIRCATCKHGKSYHAGRDQLGHCRHGIRGVKAEAVTTTCDCTAFVEPVKPKPIIEADKAARLRALRKVALENKGKAYRERNYVLQALSVAWPSHLMPNLYARMGHKWALCVHSPEGQLCWLLSDEEVESFGHLPRLDVSHWDRHTVAEREGRIRRLLELGTPAWALGGD